MQVQAEEIDRVRSFLVDTVRRATPEAGIIGAVLGGLVNHSVGFKAQDFGFKNLKAFIEEHVSEIRIIGQTGSDYIYGLREWPDLPTSGSDHARQRWPSMPSFRPDLWRIWASPMSPYRIAVDRESLTARGVHPDAPLASTEFWIEPASRDTHHATAKAFLALADPQLPSDLQDRLRPLLDTDNPSWWIEWSSLLQKHSQDTLRRWLNFRRKRLTEALLHRLKTSGLADDGAQGVTQSICNPTPGGPWSVRPTREGIVRPRSAPAISDSAPIVELVRAVVTQMRDEELRALNLPLGLVLDAVLSERQKR